MLEVLAKYEWLAAWLAFLLTVLAAFFSAWQGGHREERVMKQIEIFDFWVLVGSYDALISLHEKIEQGIRKIVEPPKLSLGDVPLLLAVSLTLFGLILCFITASPLWFPFLVIFILGVLAFLTLKTVESGISRQSKALDRAERKRRIAEHRKRKAYDYVKRDKSDDESE